MSDKLSCGNCKQIDPDKVYKNVWGICRAFVPPWAFHVSRQVFFDGGQHDYAQHCLAYQTNQTPSASGEEG